jgi:thymidylate synthase (FAD)
MKVTLLDHTIDPVNKIGLAASICYDAKIDRESNIKRATHCKSKGHLSTLRFAYASFQIEGISRVCSHQLVRIAIAGILQESQRYVKQSNIEYIIPDAVKSLPEALQERWNNLLSEANSIYAESVDQGMKKEDARYILPQSCTTKVNLCLNFQGWQDLLANRTAKASQWEIRAVAEEIQRQLAHIAPEIFGD